MTKHNSLLISNLKMFYTYFLKTTEWIIISLYLTYSLHQLALLINYVELIYSVVSNLLQESMKCIETNGFVFMEALENEAKYLAEIPAVPPNHGTSIALYECSL